MIKSEYQNTHQENKEANEDDEGNYKLNSYS